MKIRVSRVVLSMKGIATTILIIAMVPSRHHHTSGPLEISKFSNRIRFFVIVKVKIQNTVFGVDGGGGKDPVPAGVDRYFETVTHTESKERSDERREEKRDGQL